MSGHVRDFVPTSLFPDEAREHWLAVAESADRELAVVHAEEAVQEVQILTAGRELAELLGLPPEAAPLVAAVVYGTDRDLRATAAAAIVEFVRGDVRMAAA